jgi:hypothetical protein
MLRITTLATVILSLALNWIAFAEEPMELVNPGFEQTEGETVGEPSPDWEQASAPPGWSVWFGSTARASNAELAWTAEVAHSGRRSISVRSSDGPTVVMQQVPVEPGSAYAVRAWGRVSDPDCEVLVGARWKQADGAWATSAHPQTRMPADVPVGEWAQIECVVQAPENAAFLVIMLTGQGQGPEDACWFDDISVSQLTGEDLYVGPVTSWLHPMFLPSEEPPVTEHIPWAHPRAGGPLNVLFLLGNDHNTREADELAQRLEMNYDVAFCHEYDGLLFSLNDKEVRRKFAEREYDAVIVGMKISDSLAPALMDYLSDGGGVVLIGWPGMEPVLPEVAMSETPDGHYLREALDAYPQYPTDPTISLLKSLQVGESGEGRVASIRWSIRSRCLTPQLTFAEHMQMPHNYWEAFHATLARSVIWAAGEEPEEPLVVNADGASITASPVADGSLDWKIWSETGLSTLTRDDSDQTEVELPAFEAGPVFSAAVLKDAEGRVTDFACTLAQSPTTQSITSVTLDREWYAEGDTALVTVGLEDADGLRVRVTPFDAFGRELPGVEASAAGDEVTLTLPVPEAITTAHWLTVRLSDADNTFDIARAPMLIPQPHEDYFADWRLSTWGSGNAMPPYLDMTFCRQLGRTGVSSQLVSGDAMLASVTGLQWPTGYGYGLPGTGPYAGDSTVREPCFSDPAVREEILRRGGEIAAAQRGYGTICAYLRDETSLVKNDRDVCSGPYCAERYEAWLRERYPSIEALNAAWGTDFADFTEPGFIAYRDARGQDTWAPWLEFRRFMDWTWTESVELIRESIRRGDPEIPVAYPNTFGPNPFAGRDYWQLAQVSEYSMEYMTEVRGGVDTSGHRMAYEPFAQWTAPGTPHLPWVGYVHEPADIEFIPWWASLHGASGVTIYGSMSTFAGRASWAQLFPDLRITERGELYEEVTRDLREGAGKLLMSAERPQAKIALLWSQPSMYVGWMLSDFEGDPGGPGGRADDPYGSHGWSRMAWRHLIRATGRQYDWLCAEQLPEAIEGYDVLVLPATYALDERVVEAARSLLARGGTIIADMGVGITNEHGLPGARDEALAEIFDLQREAVPVWTKREMTLDGETVEVYADAEGDPSITRKDHAGGGRAFYLSFVAPRSNEMIAWLEAEGFRGLPKIAQMSHLPGEPGEYEFVRLESGPIAMLGVLRERRMDLSDGPLTLTLPEEREVYDVRAHRHLGRSDTITADLLPGQTALYALLPYRVESVTVTAADAAGGASCAITATINASAPTPGDHVLRVEVRDPAGALSDAYTRMVVSERGVATVSIPFALNDAPGDWRVAVRDVATGMQGEAIVRLSARDGNG